MTLPIIATPEGFEAILRTPESKDWIKTIGAVCIDEAHLISNVHRGPTFEHIITSLLIVQQTKKLIMQLNQ